MKLIQAQIRASTVPPNTVPPRIDFPTEWVISGVMFIVFTVLWSLLRRSIEGIDLSGKESEISINQLRVDLRSVELKVAESKAEAVKRDELRLLENKIDTFSTGVHRRIDELMIAVKKNEHL